MFAAAWSLSTRPLWIELFVFKAQSSLRGRRNHFAISSQFERFALRRWLADKEHPKAGVVLSVVFLMTPQSLPNVNKKDH